MTRGIGWIIAALILGMLLVGCGAASQGDALSQETQSTPTEDAQFADPYTPPILTQKAASTGPLRDNLNRLYIQWQTDPVQAKENAVSQGFMFDEEDRVLVTVTVITERHIEPVSEGIVALNGVVSLTSGVLMDAWIPFAKLEEASNLPGIGAINKPAQAYYPEP